MTAKKFMINTGNTQLVGEHMGTGESLLFLHAGVADRRMWHDQMADLGNDYHVVAYDRRGFGETTAVDEPFTHVEDLKSILDQLGIETAVLIGCSQGGRVAIDFPLAYPQRVTKLVLIASAVSGAPTPPKTFPADIQAVVDALDAADEADDLVRINELEAHLWLDGPTSSAGRVQGAVRELFLDMNGIALEKPDLDKEVEPASAYGKLSDLLLPTFVIWGELDFPFLKTRCQYLLDNIPAAKGQEIAGTAHLPNLEQPDLINKLLREFLS